LGSSTFRLFWSLLAISTSTLAPRLVAAQSSSSADLLSPTPQSLRVDGQVVRPGAREMVPVPGIWVTLHRVGSDKAAPLDSQRVDAKGHYSFTYRHTGDETAVYFVSAVYGGIAYFTPPLEAPVVTGDKAEIAVYDTTSAPISIGTRGHHIVVSSVDANGERSITEVYELANDSSVTRIAPGNDAKSAVWSAGVPTGARGFSVSQGDIPAAAVTFSDSHVHVFAPIAPGLAQLEFSYDLPAPSFPLSLPVQQPTQILEVLIEDEKGAVSGAKLKEKDPVTLERRSFRRFLADDVPMNAVSVIDVPQLERPAIDRRYLIGVTVIIGGTMVAALARALTRG
jgi:hypothetical protein